MTIKNKINLSLIFFLILAIFLLAFLIYPLLKDIKNYSNEIISQKKEVSSLENKIEDIEEFRKRGKFFRNLFSSRKLAKTN